MQVLKSKSGLVVLFRQLDSPLVSFRFFVQCGALDEAKKEWGLCHALEHMYFSGTPNRDWEKIGSDFRALGAYSNASTGFYSTEYEILVPKENFEPAFEVLTDLLKNSLFPEERWEKVERKAIINEMLGFENDSSWFLQDAALTDMLGAKYHNPLGSYDVIEKSSVKRLTFFSDRFYNQDNMLLAISGGVPSSRVLRLADKYANFRKGKKEKRTTPNFRINKDKYKIVLPGGTSQPLILMLADLPKLKSQVEYYEYLIATELLSNHLMQEIREKRGLCYHIHAHLGLDIPNLPLIQINTSAESPEMLKNTIKEINNVLTSASEIPPKEDKVHEAKMEVYLYSLLAESNAQEVSMRIGELFLQGWKKDLLEQPKSFLKSLSNKNIQKKFLDVCSKNFKLATLVGE